LFRVVIFAERPKTASDAASHDDAIIIHNTVNKRTKILLFL
jgi:hypothetical protein